MRKITTKVVVASVLAAAFAGGSYAVEHASIQTTTTPIVGVTAKLSSALDQSGLPKMVKVSSVALEGRSRGGMQQIDEANTVGMLLAGLAIMGLVVRRRMR